LVGLDRFFCQDQIGRQPLTWSGRLTTSIAVIDAPRAAATALHPLRRRILEQLREADSAAGVARSLSLPRQRVTYHVRELERAGLLEAVGERKKGNCVEKLVRATARSYVIAPQALGGLGAGAELPDRFSSSYLVGVAAQTLRDVARLRKEADRAGLRLPTLSLQTEVRFGGPGAQHEFAEELAEAVSRVVAKYHDEHAPEGRTFRLNLVTYPRPSPEPGAASAEGEDR
jgi:DNA-binding transcriptional ArsR family regulator